jgi:hypothetical protein
MITNINKSKYIDLIENLKKDRQIINKTLSTLENPKTGIIILGDNNVDLVKEKIVKSKSGNGEYRVRVLKTEDRNITTIYSIFPEHIVVWPIDFLFGGSSYPYIILIKHHAIYRYAERYLKIDNINLENVLTKFIDVFCLRKDPVMIKKSETDKVDSLMCRIKEGALLGYSYKVSPGILRFNTFVSDKELEETNRIDQKIIRVNSNAWKKVQ